MPATHIAGSETDWAVTGRQSRFDGSEPGRTAAVGQRQPITSGNRTPASSLRLDTNAARANRNDYRVWRVSVKH